MWAVGQYKEGSIAEASKAAILANFLIDPISVHWVDSSMLPFQSSVDPLCSAISQLFCTGDNITLSDRLRELSVIFQTNDLFFFRSFVECALPQIIVEFLNPKYSLKDQNSAITIVTRSAFFHTSDYFDALMSAGVLQALLRAQDFRIEDQAVYLQAFCFILKRNPTVITEILDAMDQQHFANIFARVLSPQVNDDLGSHFATFLVTMAAFGLPRELILMYLRCVKKLMQLFMPMKPFVRDLLDCLSAPHFFRMPFYQKMLRETGFAPFLLDFAIGNSQRLSDVDLWAVLSFLAAIFECPVAFPIEIAVFLSWCRDSRMVIRQAALFVIGNMFESMPETIDLLMDINFFDLLIAYICGNELDQGIRTEAMVCAASAIVFGSHTVQVGFLSDDFLASFFDGMGTGGNDLIFMMVDAMRVLFLAAETENGTRAALELFEANGGSQAMVDAEDAANWDERVVGAWQLLKEVIQRAKDSEPWIANSDLLISMTIEL
jgi:hypothetical protein